MSHLLAVDHLPYRVLSGWTALLRAVGIWLLLSLPLVTAPASTAMLVESVGRVVNGEAPSGVADSWRVVRRSTWPALRLVGMVAAGSVVVASALLGPSPGGAFDVVLPMVAVPVAICWMLGCQWCLPALVAQRPPRRAWVALRDSYLRAAMRPDLALLSAAGSVGVVALGIVLPMAVALPYWLTAPALCAALVAWTSDRAEPVHSEGPPKERGRH